jgi:signal transduction histidine kinase
MFAAWRERADPWILGSVAVILLAVAGIASSLIASERQNEIADTQRQITRFVTGAEAALNRSLLGIDVMLADMGTLQQLTSGGNQNDYARTNRLLASAANQNLLVRQIALLDAAGAIVASSARGGQQTTLRLPDGFLDEVRAQTIKTLVISSPAVSFASGERVLYFARQLATPAHGAMLAVAEVQISHLAKIMAQSVEIDGLEITLERTDGQLLASVPPNEVFYGKHLLAALDLAAASTVQLSTARLSDAPALVIARPTLYRNLLIAASIPIDSALADWRQERNRVIAVALAFALLILLTSVAAVSYLARLRHTRAQVRAAKAALDQALDSMTNGFLLLDRNDKVVAWNKRYVELCPWMANAMQVGMPYRRAFELAADTVIPDSEPEKKATWINNREAIHRNAIGEHEQTFPSGTILSLIERRTPDGGTVCSYSDITEKRHIEQEIRELNVTLEDRVRGRTKELEDALTHLKIAQSELVRTEKLAALGSLVAGIAHELNTPLGNGYMAMTTLRDQMEEFRSNLTSNSLTRSAFDALLSNVDTATEIALRSLERSTSLVASFKQVAVDQASANRRHFALAEIVDHVLIVLRPTLKKTPYRIEVTIAPGIELDSFPGALEQVLTNLISNAVIHAFDGRSHGIILIQAKTIGDSDVFLRISDDGKGISDEHIASIFDPFFSTRFGQGGSGLGLHICHNAVTQILGGTIAVRSAFGEGTEFVLTLPKVAPAKKAGT